MAKQTAFLDLDAIVPDVEIEVKIGGNIHKLAPITLEDFVINTQIVQNMSAQVDAAKEMEIVTKMLLRAFPTLDEATIGKMTLPQLNKLFEFAMEHNGGNQVKKEAAAEAAANPSQAGQ